MRSTRLGKSLLDICEIDNILVNDGYRFAFYGKKGELWGTIAGWVRPSLESGVFERLIFFVWGHKRDQTTIHLGVSIVPTGNTWRGAFESETFENRRFSIRNRTEVNSFLSQVVPQLSAAHQSASLRLASGLASQTKRARDAAEFYSRYLPDPSEDLDAALERQKSTGAEHDVAVAKKFPFWGTLSLPFNTEDEEKRVILCYKNVVFAMILNSAEAAEHGYFQVVTRDNLDCALCIQILASRIHSPHLWKWS